MGLGLQAAYGQEAMQQALRQRIADQIAQQQREAQAKQQEFENATKTRQLNQVDQSMQLRDTPAPDREVVQVDEGGKPVYMLRGQAIGKPAYVKPETTPADPLVEVNEGGTPIYRPRSQAIGKPAYVKPESPKLDTTGDLSPEGLDAAASLFAKTGQLPSLGMGAANLRAKIINRAAAMMPDLDLAANKADYGANTQTLAALQKQRSAIGAFEQTAQKNIDLFLETAGKVVDTGSPLANMLVREASGQVLGSPDQARYDAARQVAVNEIAKITSNPTLAGQLSDSARKEVAAFNPAGATLKQTVAVMRLLKQDMKNRTDSMDEQISGIQGRLKGRSGTPAKSAYERYVERQNAEQK